MINNIWTGLRDTRIHRTGITDIKAIELHRPQNTTPRCDSGGVVTPQVVRSAKCISNKSGGSGDDNTHDVRLVRRCVYRGQLSELILCEHTVENRAIFHDLTITEADDPRGVACDVIFVGDHDDGLSFGI